MKIFPARAHFKGQHIYGVATPRHSWVSHGTLETVPMTVSKYMYVFFNDITPSGAQNGWWQRPGIWLVRTGGEFFFPI